MHLIEATEHHGRNVDDVAWCGEENPFPATKNVSRATCRYCLERAAKFGDEARKRLQMVAADRAQA